MKILMLTIFFYYQDTKLYVPVVTLSAKNNKKFSKLLSKGFKRLVDWNQYKTKSKNKNMANVYFFWFSTQTLLESIDYLYQFMQMKLTLLKDLMLEILFTKRYNQKL